MTASKDEREVQAQFSDRYALESSAVVQEIEREVIGEVWGANGFTTVSQADLLAGHLELDSSSRLLDIGTGRGWPGLYLAKKTGCEVVVTDLPHEGLVIAAQRARTEGIRCLGEIVSSAKALPFTDASFDAIVHSDVLC